jgi:hypothetical protein
MDTNFALQSNPAYAGQSGSNPAQYPAQGISTPITPSGAGDWVTDYNSVGYMTDDPVLGGSYYAPQQNIPVQSTLPASQVGIANPLAQSIYETYRDTSGTSNVVYAGGSSSFNEATGQYTNVTTNPIANPTSLPTHLSTTDLFGSVSGSSGLFLDTPVVKQNATSGTTKVDTKTAKAAAAQPAEGGGLGLTALGLIALKLLVLK